jgi:hypothetical protein
MQHWYKFYSTLRTEDRTEFIEEEEWKMESTNLTFSDIDIIIKNMKNGTSSGSGNFNLELIKYGGRTVLTLVTK